MRWAHMNNFNAPALILSSVCCASISSTSSNYQHQPLQFPSTHRDKTRTLETMETTDSLDSEEVSIPPQKVSSSSYIQKTVLISVSGRNSRNQSLDTSLTTTAMSSYLREKTKSHSKCLPAFSSSHLFSNGCFRPISRRVESLPRGT